MTHSTAHVYNVRTLFRVPGSYRYKFENIDAQRPNGFAGIPHYTGRTSTKTNLIRGDDTKPFITYCCSFYGTFFGILTYTHQELDTGIDLTN